MFIDPGYDQCMWEAIKKENEAKVLCLLMLLLSTWWGFLLLSGINEQLPNYIFGGTYGIIALLGGIWGIKIAYKWGGFKSVFGRAILFFSFGLLSQEFGQLVFSYYNLFAKIPVPYPSLADVGFFGVIPLYSIGMLYLAQAAGVKFSLKSISNKLQVILIPLIMLSISYYIFLATYTVDTSDILRTFLDFAYPLGDALYISLAILTFSLSRGLLGGIMRSRILFLIIAFCAQYVADFNFLFQSSQGTWSNAGYGDYLYLISYFMMTLGILQLNTVFNSLKHSDK